MCIFRHLLLKRPLLIIALIGWVAYGLWVYGSRYVIPDTYWMDVMQDDTRPEHHILFLGNGMIAAHNTPLMVRHIADSAGSMQRLVISSYTPAGYYMQHHWQDDNVQRILSPDAGWDTVFVQPNTGEAAFSDKTRSITNLHTYAGRLIKKVDRMEATPVLFGGPSHASSGYGKTWWREYKDGSIVTLTEEEKDEHIQRMQSSMRDEYDRLAARHTILHMDIARVWEVAAREHPEIVLYHPDGNRPSIQGSYLNALIIYKYLSQDADLANVTYTPEGISPQEADALKALVASI